jgi:CheY-like chemotaxis protein
MREAMEFGQVEAPLYVVNDGDKAVRFIQSAEADEAAPCPALIVLDLNLPKKSGTEVLAYLRASRKCPDTIVVIATSSDSAVDRESVAKFGIRAYFCKPSNYDGFMKLGDIVRELLDADTPGPGGFGRRE